MNYNNQTCPVCGEVFDQNDDIVVCPECATPHHRECWASNGKCANTELHESGYIWSKADAPQPAEETEAETVGDVRICHVCGSENPADIPNCGNCGAYFGENKKNEGEENKCHFCGKINSDDAKHCNQCGAPLNIDTNATSTAFFGSNPYIAGTDIKLDDKIGDNTAGDLAIYTRTSAKRYLKKFKKFANGKKLSFNFAALFLSPGWFFYRKLYKAGIFFLVAFTTITILTSGQFNKINSSLENYSSQVTAAYDDFYSAYNNPDITEEELMVKSQAVTNIATQHFKETWKSYLIYFGSPILLSLASALIADKLYYKKASEDLIQINEESHDEPVRRVLIARKGGVAFFAFLACFYGQRFLPSLFGMAADIIKDLI